MHPKYLVFFRPGLLVAALGCGAPAASAQVVIHPEWLVTYAFPAATDTAFVEPPAAFAGPAFAAEPQTAFAVGLQLTALFSPPEIPCRGVEIEYPCFGACFAPRGLGDALFPGD